MVRYRQPAFVWAGDIAGCFLGAMAVTWWIAVVKPLLQQVELKTHMRLNPKTPKGAELADICVVIAPIIP